MEHSCRRHGLINAPRAILSDMAGLVVGIVLSLWLSGYLLSLVLQQRGFGLNERLGLLNVALAFLLALATGALAVLGTGNGRFLSARTKRNWQQQERGSRPFRWLRATNPLREFRFA